MIGLSLERRAPSNVLPLSRALVASGLALAAIAPRSPAQVADSARARPEAPVVAVGSYTEETLRDMQLTDSAPTAGFLLRSLSSMSPRLAGSDSAIRWRWVLPQATLVTNSDLPYSLNDGALWAGRGGNFIAFAGVRAEWKRLHLFVLPEFTTSDNRDYPPGPVWAWEGRHTLANPLFFNPLPGRNPFSSPFHPVAQSIDLPIRFGPSAYHSVRLGQSTLFADAGPVSVGASTENEWWGPGIRNALVLSNNAPGFPHLFVRTSHPLETPLGAFELHYLLGGLSESKYFDSDRSDDLRSISMAALTWQPRWERDLTIGAARAVYAPVKNWGGVAADALWVFRDVGQPDSRSSDAAAAPPGPDQIMSLFFRWLAPSDGFEAYGEWGRAEFPRSLRDFAMLPNHSQAYTMGVQWMGDPVWRGGRPRLQTEFSYLQQDPSYRQEFTGSWYTSAAVPQGYTNEGQVLGAAIGPGSSSQWFAFDWVTPTWLAGLNLNRVRWLEDVHAQVGWPWGFARGWCEHDVSLLKGARVARRTPIGTFQASYSVGWRVNVFFENRAAGCFQDAGRDVYNKSLTLSFQQDVPLHWPKKWQIGE